MINISSLDIFCFNLFSEVLPDAKQVMKAIDTDKSGDVDLEGFYNYFQNNNIKHFCNQKHRKELPFWLFFNIFFMIIMFCVKIIICNRIEGLLGATKPGNRFGRGR